MRDIILFLSLAINVLIIGVIGWFGFQAYGTFKSAMASSSSPVSASIIDVIEVNDSGYKARFYILNKAGDKVVVSDYNLAGIPRKNGDLVKLQVIKNSISGTKTVNYMISP